MNSKVKIVSTVEAIKAFKRAGWTIDRVRGSHTFMIKDEREVNIPKRKAISYGTMKMILRDAGYTPDEFNKFLKGEKPDEQ